MSLCSQTSQLSLVEQKKLQWAKEREEMMRLGGLWGSSKQTELKRSKILPPIRDNQESQGTGLKNGEESETSGYLSDSPKHWELNWQRQTPDSLLSTPEDRLKWGDRGVGVGHLWEPVTDRPETRLPQESQRTTPRWVERHAKDGLHSADILYIHHEEDGKNYLLGQNAPVPPEILEERERRRQKALEHQNAIRRQLEEREKRRKEEKEARLNEERQEEERIRKECEKEQLRLEAERKKIAEKEEKKRETELMMERALNAAKENSKKSIKISHKVDEEIKLKEMNISVSEIVDTSKVELKESCCQTELEKTNTSECSVQVDLDHSNVLINSVLLPLRQKRVLTPSKYRKGAYVADAITQTGRCSVGNRSRRRCSSKTCSGCSSLSERSNSSERTYFSRTCNIRESSIRRRSQPRMPLHERPKWGINRPVIQYKKQSEKDPHYMRRIRRRAARNSKAIEHVEAISEKLLQTDRQFLPFHTDDEIKDKTDQILQNGFRMLSNPSSPRFVPIRNIQSPKSSIPSRSRTDSETKEKSDDSLTDNEFEESHQPHSVRFHFENESSSNEKDSKNVELTENENDNGNSEVTLNSLVSNDVHIDDVDDEDVISAKSTTEKVLQQINCLKQGLKNLQKESPISTRSSTPLSPVKC